MSREIDFNKTLTEDEAAYVQQRPWIIEDQRLLGVNIKWPKQTAEPEPEEEDEEIDYNDLSVKELKAEIDARQQEGHAIEPATEKKADLIAALQQDDVQSANTFSAE